VFFWDRKKKDIKDIKIDEISVERALSIANRLEDYYRSLALSEIASALAMAGEIERAREMFEEAIEVANRLEDDYRSWALKDIASALAMAGEIERALSIANRLEDLDRSMALKDIASALAMAGEIERAREMFEEAIEVANRLEDDYRSWALKDIASALAKLALTPHISASVEKLLKNGEYAKALQKYKFMGDLRKAAKIQTLIRLRELHGKAKNLGIPSDISEVENLVSERKVDQAVERAKVLVKKLSDMLDRYYRYSKIEKMLQEAERLLNELKSKNYYTENIEKLLVEAKDLFSKGMIEEAEQKAMKITREAQKIKELHQFAIEKLDYLKTLYDQAKSLGIQSNVSEIENLISMGHYQMAIEKAENLIKTFEEQIKTSVPKLSISLQPLKFKLKVGTRAIAVIYNSGSTHAVDIDIQLELDEYTKNSVAYRILSVPDRIEPGESSSAEIWFKFVDEGEYPVTFSVKYRDGLGREYEERQEIWIKVVSEPDSIEETIPPQELKFPSDFTPKPTTPKTFPPELSDSYTEVEFIGKGGFARVFKARRNDGKLVAVKLPISLDPATGKSFIKELTNWTRLEHENIVKVFDYNILPIPFFEMELCDQSLADLPKPVDAEKAAWIIFNVAEGLKYAHSMNVIHRDLKPQNILLRDGIPKISDWGLSKVLTESSSTSVTSFTPYYAAPEQIAGIEKDERTDIWQLGVIFYELVTGELPFKGDNVVEVGMAIATRHPVSPSEINPEAKEVEHIIMKCLEKEKEKRYQSVIELQKDLANYLGIKYSESLKESVSQHNMRRSAYYCGELMLINLRVGEIVNAYKFASDLVNYADGDVRVVAEELCNQLRARMEAGISEIADELIKKAEIIAHKVRVGLERI